MGETTSKPERKPRSQRQVVRNADIQRRLIEAAAKVIGQHGYAGASIARITAEAGVAHGAFYLHFANRQALFDILLPTLGRSMLDAIRLAVHDSHSIEELERRGVKANFDYFVKNPAMYRIIVEAQISAPAAFRQFVSGNRSAYVRSLRRSRDLGDVADFSDEEIDMISALLIGARMYLVWFCMNGTKIRPLTEQEIQTYVDMVVAGLRRPGRGTSGL